MAKPFDLEVNMRGRLNQFKTAIAIFPPITHRSNHLLVNKLLETVFKVLVSRLHSLSQLLQNLQKKKGERKMQGEGLWMVEHEGLLHRRYLLFASAQLPLDLFGKVTRGSFWTVRHA